MHLKGQVPPTADHLLSTAYCLLSLFPWDTAVKKAITVFPSTETDVAAPIFIQLRWHPEHCHCSATLLSSTYVRLSLSQVLLHNFIQIWIENHEQTFFQEITIVLATQRQISTTCTSFEVKCISSQFNQPHHDFT